MSDKISYSVSELIESFNELSARNDEFRNYLLSRAGHATYSIAPGFAGNSRDADMGLIIDTLTGLDYKTPKAPRHPVYGALMIDSQGLELIEPLKEAKSRFKDIAKWFNKSRETSKTIHQYKNRQDPGRSDVLNTALQHIGKRNISLNQCYRKISFVEVQPKSISFTWQRNHTVRKTFKRCEDALAMCEKHSNNTDHEDWENKIKSFNYGKYRLVQITKRDDQLRANIVLVPGRPPKKDGSGGEGITKHISSPTIILVNGTQLPWVNYVSPDQLNIKKSRSGTISTLNRSLGFLSLYAMPYKSDSSDILCEDDFYIQDHVVESMV